MGNEARRERKRAFGQEAVDNFGVLTVRGLRGVFFPSQANKHNIHVDVSITHCEVLNLCACSPDNYVQCWHYAI